MRSWRVLLTVVLPVLMLVTSIAFPEYRLRVATTWRCPIEGFDPRDLLRGRYIRFRLRFVEDQPLEMCSAMDPHGCCLCLDRQGDATAVPRMRRATCATARAPCEGTLSLRDADREQRYYVPETRAREFEDKVQGAVRRGTAYVELSIHRGSRPQIRRIIIDGEPLP
jgi:hypothetical protein